MAWEPDLTVAFDKHICGHLGNHFTLLNVLDGSWEWSVSRSKWAVICPADRVVSPSTQGEQWLFIPFVPEAFPI